MDINRNNILAFSTILHTENGAADHPAAASARLRGCNTNMLSVATTRGITSAAAFGNTAAIRTNALGLSKMNALNSDTIAVTRKTALRLTNATTFRGTVSNTNALGGANANGMALATRSIRNFAKSVRTAINRVALPLARTGTTAVKDNIALGIILARRRVTTSRDIIGRNIAIIFGSRSNAALTSRNKACATPVGA